MNGKQLKNSILQWAIQGKLVPQDPNDEPASVLLERIRAEKARLVKEKKIKKDKNESIIYRGDDNSYYEKFLATGEVKCIDDEIPFEIPNGWEWERIGNIFNHTSGKQQSSSNKSGGTPQKFITTSNLYWGYFVLDNVKVMNFTEDEIKSCSATKGDLLVCEGGAGYGRSAIWNYDYDICLQNHVHRLRPLVDGICEYVFYFMYLQKESNNLASVGTAMPGLSANKLKSLLIPLPPTAVKNDITDILKKVFPIVEKYDKVQEKLNLLNSSLYDALKKSILQEAIQGRLVPQFVDEGTAQELLEQIRQEKQKLVKEGKLKKSALTDSVIYKGDDNKYYEQVGNENIDITEEIPFDLPENWTWVRFGQYVRMSIGKTPPRGETKYWANGKYPWVSISDMSDYGLVTTTKESVSEYAKSLFGEISPVGTLIMSFKLTVGRSSLLNTSAYHNEAIISIYPFVDKNYQARNFLFHILPIISNLGDTKDAIKGKTLNSKSLNNLLLPLPPLNEQGRIVAMIELLFDKLK
ncbi:MULTISPECIES: restriction endonuclease subunit S [Bacteroidales]|uniref:restriction endonuclease subunit S n=1 Tax=Bacteroidales TaxID=171549 RepID=UPI001CCE210E|nr:MULTISPECIES: restriction endonuclease subunit S [Bacteroidales]MCM1739363.1 restriction endonuclease subunit S [Phocaeicola vulgatus]MCM1907153.1 restriction endonuclease subunit S [Phocaeicola vulgatus]MCM1915239.1 restriction endonuclease subunit S [Phocaeicola vulgatus]MCM1923480.1 restriction endonuclease subunit S [Phocaeicola vulgatus]MDB9066450.1 restriction endonuclease subunit S [Parabacteroides merdae]